MAGVLGLDLATHLNGYCVGNGLSTPEAGAWALADHYIRDKLGKVTACDIGALLEEHSANVTSLITAHDVDEVIFECPILTQFDKLLTVRIIYALGGETEHLCRRIAKARGRPLRCTEVDLRRVKKELTGRSDADKAEMVRIASGMGIALPKAKTDGREDAADAVGVWKYGLNSFDPHTAARWDARIMRARGGLLC